MNQERASFLGRPIKLIVGLGALLGGLWFIWAIRGVLAPFVLAFVLAYVLAPLVDRMEGRGLNRALSILIVFLLVLSCLVLGAFKAGAKLTAEMIELSEQFLVQEAVEREFTIENKGSQEIHLDATWEEGEEGEAEAEAFSWVEPTSFPIVISPETEKVLKLRFAPSKTRQMQGNFRLSSSQGSPVSFGLAVRGNFSPGGERAADSQFWEKGWHKQPLEMPGMPGLVFSARGIDFGRAGPNIITRLSEEASKIQLWLESKFSLGDDFNLSELIRREGSVLAKKLLGGTTEVLGGVFSGITFVVIVPFVAFFLLKEGHRITHGLIELVPNAYFELCLNLLYQINGQIGGYIRGLILATTVVGALSVGGLTLVSVPYALPVGIVAGLANMIPFLGPLIGILTASIVALATGGGFAMVGKVVIVFLIIQLIDNVLIQPIILAKSVDLHPLVVLFVVLVGGQLMGLVGMLIAVPMTGVLKVTGQTIYQGIKGYRIQ